MDLQHLKFDNVVGLDLERAKSLIREKLVSMNISYTLYTKTYSFKNKKESSAQTPHQIFLWVDKNNEIVTTPYIQFNQKSTSKLFEEEEYDINEQERDMRYHEYFNEDDDNF
jgi:hypothetical protein